MQPYIKSLPALPAAGAAPDHGLNNWQVMKNLGKFNAADFGNILAADAAANANADFDAANANTANVGVNDAGSNEVVALNALMTCNTSHPTSLLAERRNNDAVLTHYYLKVLGARSSLDAGSIIHPGAPGAAGAGYACTVNDILTQAANLNCRYNALGAVQPAARTNTAANRRAILKIGANGFFVWLQQVISAPVAQVPLETKQALLQTIKQTLQGKTVVANNAVPANANEIKAKDAIVQLVQAVHQNPKIANLLPVNGWGVRNVHNAGGNGFNNLDGGSREIRQLNFIRHLIAWDRAGNASVNGFSANNAAAAAGAVVANDIYDDAIAEVNTIFWNGDVKYTAAQVPHNPFIMSIQKRMADPHIGLQDKKAYLAALQNAMSAAHVANGNAWPANQAEYDTFMHSVASEMARQFPGKFQIGGGDIAGNAQQIIDKNKAIEALYNAIGGNGDIEAAVKDVNTASIVHPITKIQGGYDYDSGRAVSPIQHAIHVLSECTDDEKFTKTLSMLEVLLKDLQVQAPINTEDLAIAVQKFTGKDDAKLARVLALLIPHYKQPAELVAAFMETQPYKEVDAVQPSHDSVPANKIAVLLQKDTTPVQYKGLFDAMQEKQKQFTSCGSGSVDVFDGTSAVNINAANVKVPNIPLDRYAQKYLSSAETKQIEKRQYDKIFDKINGTNQEHREKILNNMQALYDKVKEKLSPDEQADYKEAAQTIARGGGIRLKFAAGLLGNLYKYLNDKSTDVLNRQEENDFKNIIDEIKNEINSNIEHYEDCKKQGNHRQKEAHQHKEKHYEKVDLKQLKEDIFTAASKARIEKGSRKEVAKLIAKFAKNNGGVRGNTKKKHKELHEEWGEFRRENPKALKDVDYKTACKFSEYFTVLSDKRLAEIDPKDINATLKENGRDRG